MEDKTKEIQQNQDKQLKELFTGFQPELSSQDKFLSRLENSFQAVDIVNEHAQSVKHKNYIAIAVAFFAGIIVGVGLSLLFPLLIEWSLTIFVSSPSPEVIPVNFNWKIIGWIVIAITCIFTAKNAYDVTLYKLSGAELKKR